MTGAHEGIDVSPVSFPVHVARLPRKGIPFRIEADETQRRALADVHGLVSVGRFVADLVVVEWSRDGIRVEGHVEADIVQECVVTLDPLPASIREPVERYFVPERSKLARQDGLDASGELVISPDGPDIPDVFSGDEIDVGAVAEETFALGIDPYPRKAGLAADAPLAEEAEPRVSPFAALQKLKRDS